MCSVYIRQTIKNMYSAWFTFSLDDDGADCGDTQINMSKACFIERVNIKKWGSTLKWGVLCPFPSQRDFHPNLSHRSKYVYMLLFLVDVSILKEHRYRRHAPCEGLYIELYYTKLRWLACRIHIL